MAGDPTGMRGAQVRDRNQENASRGGRAISAARGAGRAVWSFVPGTQAKRERIADNRIRMDQLVAQRTGQAGPEAQQEQQPVGGATKGGSTSDMVGEVFTQFSRDFRETLRRSRTMGTRDDVEDAVIRQVLCSQPVIDVIKDDTICPTPIEWEQPGCFKEQRSRLAAMLEARTVGQITAEQLDILFVTMVGRREAADGKTEFWSAWPNNGLPRPDQAFFQYLEGVAVRRAAAGGTTPGRFIGEALKSMAESRTVGSSKGGVRSLIDHSYVDGYLTRRAAEPIDRTVGAFGQVLDGVMQTPADQIHSETGVPGLGFEPVDEQAVRDKEREVLTARQTAEAWARQANDLEGKNGYDEAVQNRDAAIAVHHRRVGELQALVDNANAAVLTRERLVTTFRDTLLEQGDTTDLANLHERMKWAKNPAVEALMDDIDDVLAEKGALQAAIMDEVGRAGAEEKRPQPATILEQSLSKEHAGFRASVQRLRQAVEDANIPEEVKQELRDLIESIENINVPRAMIDERKDKLRKRYAYPLVEVTKLALRRLEQSGGLRIGEIKDDEWVIARTIWERSGEEIASQPIRARGFWDRLSDGVVRWTTTLYGIKKILGILATLTTLRLLHRNLLSRHRSEAIPNRTATGEVDEKKPEAVAFGLFTLRNWHKGLVHLGLLCYAAATAYVGLMHSPSMGAHYWRGPIESRGYLTAAVTPKTYRRTIDDSYDIPDRLQKRDAEYYTDTYGVTDPENLAWLRKHPEVLRFFQERRSLRKVKSWETLGDTPETCSTKQSPLPNSCKRLGLETEEAIANYSGGVVNTDDGWEPKRNMPVCCLIGVEFENIGDGLKLNPGEADAFVSYLRTQEGGKAAVDGTYLNDAENMLTWTDKRFLVSQQQDNAMRVYGISDVPNVEFAVAQKSHLQRKLKPCVVVGDATVFVKEEHRDAFVTAWREAVAAREDVEDPRLDSVSEATMDETFAATLETAGKRGWTRNTEAEYKEKKLSAEFEQLNLRTQTSKDIYIAQEDVRELMQKFIARGAEYRVNPGRSDELVRLLDSQKRAGTPVVEFDPFVDPPGKRAQGLANAGLIGRTETFEGAKQTRGDSPTTTNAMSEEAQNFYNNDSHADFNTFLNARIEAMFDDANAGEAMRQAYGGDREATARAIRGEVHRLLTSGSTRDARLRESYGISVSGEGEEMKITFDARNARRGLSGHISRFVRQHGRATQ
jgi:hypothetical protein